MLNILIVEDIFNDMEQLCSLINEVLNDCRLVKAGDAKQAIRLMCEHDIDVFFLDISSSKVFGFEMAQKIRENQNYQFTPIIFITGREFNIAEMQKLYHHYDSIQKPYTRREFHQSIDLLLRGLNQQKKNQLLPRREIRRMIFIETDELVTNIALNHIYYVESMGRMLNLFTKTNNYHLVKTRLEKFIDDANSTYFVRCHKSFGINVKNVLSVASADRRLWSACFDHEKTISCPISQTYYEQVITLIKKLSGNQ